MRITFHEPKRLATLQARGLDFADAAEVLGGLRFTRVDRRRDYGETRLQTVGRLGGVLVMVVWTPRDGAGHIISMRRCNDREHRQYADRLV